MVAMASPTNSRYRAISAVRATAASVAARPRRCATSSARSWSSRWTSPPGFPAWEHSRWSAPPRSTGWRAPATSTFTSGLRSPPVTLVGLPGPVVVVAVDGLDRDLLDLAATQHLQRDVHAGITGFPQLDVEIGLSLDALPVDGNDDVAGADVGLFRGAFWRDAGHDHIALDFLRIDADPWPWAPGWLAVGNKIAEQRLHEVYGYEHIARHLRARAQRVAHNKGTDPKELAFAIQQRRPAPIDGRRRGVDRLIQQILPVADEWAARDDVRGRHAVESHDQHHLSFRDCRRMPKLNRPDRQRAQCLEEPEAGGVVVPNNRGGECAPIGSGELDGFRLDDEIADGEDEALRVDDDPGAFALRAERAHGARIGDDLGAHL